MASLRSEVLVICNIDESQSSVNVKCLASPSVHINNTRLNTEPKQCLNRARTVLWIFVLIYQILKSKTTPFVFMIKISSCTIAGHCKGFFAGPVLEIAMFYILKWPFVTACNGQTPGNGQLLQLS